MILQKWPEEEEYNQKQFPKALDFLYHSNHSPFHLNLSGITLFLWHADLSSCSTMALPATLDPAGPLDDSYANGLYANSWPRSLTFIVPRMGALYIGALFSAVVYGFCLLQTFLYFQSKLPFYVPRNDLYVSRVCTRPMVYQDNCESSEHFYTPDMCNHNLLQVITLMTFNTIQLCFVGMSRES